MPKATRKKVPAEEDEDTALHGTINPEEAKIHIQTLDDALEELTKSIQEGATENIMRKTVICFRHALKTLAPVMEEANVDIVLAAIKDASCMALMPCTEDQDERLEEIMPEEDLPSGSDITAQVRDLNDITPEQGELLAELFKELEVAHDSLAKASSILGRLSRSLSGKHLLTVLKASMHPLIQINTLENFWKDPAIPQQRIDLPEDTHRRVKLTMTPDPMMEVMRHENINSPTRLLAATLAYKILKKFGAGTTQKEMQERYGVRPKQLVFYITGRKYLGGMDKKSLVRKCKAPEDSPEPSTSAE